MAYYSSQTTHNRPVAFFTDDGEVVTDLVGPGGMLTGCQYEAFEHRADSTFEGAYSYKRVARFVGYCGMGPCMENSSSPRIQDLADHMLRFTQSHTDVRMTIAPQLAPDAFAEAQALWELQGHGASTPQAAPAEHLTI